MCCHQPRDPPRHICDTCLRTFPQTRHRASSVFCLQFRVEYRPSDSFLFRLKRRLAGFWEQPPEQNFVRSIIYIWHVQQQLRSDEEIWRGSPYTDINTSVLSGMSESRRNCSFEPVLFYWFDWADSQSFCESREFKGRQWTSLKTLKLVFKIATFSLWNLSE